MEQSLFDFDSSMHATGDVVLKIDVEDEYAEPGTHDSEPLLVQETVRPFWAILNARTGKHISSVQTEKEFFVDGPLVGGPLYHCRKDARNVKRMLASKFPRRRFKVVKVNLSQKDG